MLTIFAVFLVSFLDRVYAKEFDLDYTKANKNTKVYEQVSQNVLIYSKYQAIEPRHFSDNPLRGKGFMEPVLNEIILKMRENKIEVYVDYFTSAKFGFYARTPGYEICGSANRTFRQYKKFIKQKYHGSKLLYVGRPLFFLSAVGTVAFGQKKRNLFAKHLWPRTNIYNTKSLLDDPELFTAQITASGTIIKEYIYTNTTDNILIPKYRKNVYDFVASNAFQIPMMLKGKRFDWIDITTMSDFFIKKLNIGADIISLAPISNTHPDTHSIDDIIVTFPFCVGVHRNKMEMYIKLINEIVVKRRTNLNFWKAVLHNFAQDMEIPNDPPENFYYTKTMVEWKKEIDKGEFDL